MSNKNYSQPAPALRWEFVTDHVARLKVAEGYLWKVRGETFFTPSPEYLERLVESAKSVYAALMERETKH